MKRIVVIGDDDLGAWMVFEIEDFEAATEEEARKLAFQRYAAQMKETRGIDIADETLQ